jgi:hypothetical protein
MHQAFVLVRIAGRSFGLYYLKVASIVGKRINGRTYYYLATSARVSGRPRIVSQTYLGSADDIAAAVASAAGSAAGTTHLPFGDVAATWHMLGELRLAEIVDGIIGRQRATVSAGQLLAIAVLHRIVAPASTDIAQWWPTTSAARFVRPRIPADVLTARRIRRALARVGQAYWPHIEAALSVRIRELLQVKEEQALIVDLPDFATYVERDDSTATARLAGLAMVVSLDGTVPLITRPYRHTDDEDTTFPALADELIRRYDQHCSGGGAITVLTGVGQDPPTGRHFLAPLAPGDHPNLIAAPLAGYRSVEPNRLPGVAALDRRARVGGAEHRVVCVHSTNLQAVHDRALARDLTHVRRRLDELAAALRSGRRSRAEVAAEIARITRFRWGDRVLATQLTNSLEWRLDERALARLRTQLFGKQLLVTDHEDWPVAQVITASRTRYHLESTARYLGGGDVPAADLPAYTLVTVLATTVMHLMRHRAQQAGLDLSVRELFDGLRDIQETELRTPATGGRPRTRRIRTDPDELGRQLFDLFDLSRYASG